MFRVYFRISGADLGEPPLRVRDWPYVPAIGEAVEVGADRFHVQKRVTRTDDGSGPGSVTVWLKPALAKP